MLGQLEEKIGYVFQDQSLLKRAFMHASAREGVHSYERLEFLGDRVLALCLSDLLLHTFESEAEGPLAKRLAYLASAPCIQKVSSPLNLVAYVTTTAQHPAASQKLAADLCEALIGAIYLDGGLAPAKAFIQSLWEPIMKEQPEPPQDSKTLLQEWLQARGMKLPEYLLEERTGPEHRSRFVVSITIDPAAGIEGKVMGEGTTVRMAEKNAAAAMLEKLMK